MKRILSLLLLTPILAMANSWQPTKPIDVTIGFPAGSGNDLVFRPLAAIVEKNTGAKFTINNRPGAGGTVANEAFVKMPADGYHINVISSAGPFAMDKTFPNFQNKAPYTVNDFTYVMAMATSPMVIVAHPKDPVNTPKQLVEVLVRDPVTVGDSGATGRLSLESLLLAIDARKKNPKLVRVEYKGPTNTLTDVAGGHLRFGSLPLTVAYPLHQSGQVKIVAVSSLNRISELPNVGAISEVVKDFDVTVNWGLVLPKDAPAEIVAWYNKAFQEALNSSEVKEIFAKNLFKTNPQLLDPKAFESYMKRQDRKFQPTVNVINSSIQQSK